MSQAPKTAKVEAYAFDPKFERAMVTLLCKRPKLFGRIGMRLEVDGLADELTKLALSSAQMIEREHGNGPDSTIVIIQRLRRLMTEGRVTQTQIAAVSDLFDAAEDAGLPSDESVANEVVPILKRRAQLAAVRTGMDTYAARGDFAAVEAAVAMAGSIGTVDESIGEVMGDSSFDAILASQQLERLPSGIPELDIEIDGGLWRGALGVWLGGAGDGKSMALTHCTATALLQQRNVAVATLELPEPLWLARVKANLTGIPTSELTSVSMPLARRRLQALQGKLGKCVVKYFTAHATTVEDLKAWIASVEDKWGEAVDLRVIDYADKLSAKGAKDEYSGMRVVYEGLRVWSEADKRWTWTASQSTRKDAKTGRKKNDLDHMADSMHKGRVADLVIGMSVEDETRELSMFVAKNRIGKGRMSVGPLPTEFECARLVPRP